MVRTTLDPTFGELLVTGLPMRFSSLEPSEAEPGPPARGEHNAEVLEELLGVSADRIVLLEESGALIAAPDRDSR